MSRSIRFRYNPVFLPEYLSTVLISMPISAVFLTTPVGGGWIAVRANPHLGVAIGLYVLVAGWFLGLTILYRRRFCPVTFHCLGKDQVWFDAGGGPIALPHVAAVRPSLGKFFGRTVRTLHVEDFRGTAAVFCDAIFHFDSLHTLLNELLGDYRTAAMQEEATTIDRVQALWKERHSMFPASESLADIATRLSWRGVCLLPVAVFDVLINLATILSLSRFQQHSLMVYSAPLSLLVSGVVARFVYYYMFTSTTMNKPLGVKTR